MFMLVINNDMTNGELTNRWMYLSISPTCSRSQPWINWMRYETKASRSSQLGSVNTH